MSNLTGPQQVVILFRVGQDTAENVVELGNQLIDAGGQQFERVMRDPASLRSAKVSRIFSVMSSAPAKTAGILEIAQDHKAVECAYIPGARTPQQPAALR